MVGEHIYLVNQTALGSEIIANKTIEFFEKLCKERREFDVRTQWLCKAVGFQCVGFSIWDQFNTGSFQTCIKANQRRSFAMHEILKRKKSTDPRISNRYPWISASGAQIKTAKSPHSNNFAVSFALSIYYALPTAHRRENRLQHPRLLLARVFHAHNYWRFLPFCWRAR